MIRSCSTGNSLSLSHTHKHTHICVPMFRYNYNVSMYTHTQMHNTQHIRTNNLCHVALSRSRGVDRWWRLYPASTVLVPPSFHSPLSSLSMLPSTADILYCHSTNSTTTATTTITIITQLTGTTIEDMSNMHDKNRGNDGDDSGHNYTNSHTHDAIYTMRSLSLLHYLNQKNRKTTVIA
jgi:hypothetical protein